MGTPIPPPLIINPVPAGNPCTNAWGVGKPFGDVPTPESIVVTMSGMNRTGTGFPFPPLFLPNGSFVVPQIPLTPCTFFLLIDTWELTVQYRVSSTLCQLGIPDGFVDFVGFELKLKIGATSFVNKADFNNVGGTALVHIPGII